MKVHMRWFNDNGTEYGNGRNAFEREAMRVLAGGYRTLRLSELTPGELSQLTCPEAIVLETPDGYRACLCLYLEPERGEE